jgi:hypothetical protein
MSLLSVVREVCANTGVLMPSSVFANINGNRTMQEMLAHANEIAQRITADTRNWTKLKTLATLTGDGVTTAFDLPENYLRMPFTANVWSSASTQSPLRFVPGEDDWVRRRANNDTSSYGEWTMMGGQMHIFPALAAGTTASFAYISKNSIALGGGGFSDTFMGNDDTFIISERLLRLGMIWQWKASKGSPYAEDMGTYSDALSNASGFDSPAPIIIGRTPISVNAQVAYPWPLPTPPT